MIRRNWLQGVFVLGAVLCETWVLQAQSIFAAREFLLTRQFKVGIDIHPESSGSPMAIHSAGIYLAGSFHMGSGDYQAFLRKYDISGAELWTQQITATDSILPAALAADAGGVYLASAVGHYGRRELLLRKYDALGKELWSRQFHISQNASHRIAGLAIDDVGVYVAAWDGISQGMVRKYSLAGTKLWVRSIPVRSLVGLSADGTGVSVAGTNDTGSFVSKFAASGLLAWTRPLRHADNETNMPAALAADAAATYVGGSIYRRSDSERLGFLPATQEAFLQKLDANGSPVWSRRFGPAGTGLGSLTVDASGVYAAGNVQRVLPGHCKSGEQDVFVRKYDFAGNELWTRQFGTAGTDIAGQLTVDQGGLFMSGGVWRGPAHGSLFLIKLAKSANVPDDTRPSISWECIVNAASFSGGAIAPGEIVNIFGRGIGPPSMSRARLTSEGRIGTTLADTRILFDGIAAPLLFVSATQSSAIVPRTVAERSSVLVEVEYRGIRSQPLVLPVVRAHPGVFTVDGSGSGPGVILNQDGGLNSARNPAERGSVIVLYVTGGGLTDSGDGDGQMIGDVRPTVREPLSVRFDDPRLEQEGGGSSPAEVIFAGGVSGSVAGLLEIRVRVPEWARTGSSIPLSVQIGPASTDSGATVALR